MTSPLGVPAFRSSPARPCLGVALRFCMFSAGAQAAEAVGGRGGGRGGGAGGPRAEKGGTASVRAQTPSPLWPAAFWWLSTWISVFWNHLSTLLLGREFQMGCHLQGSKPRLKGLLWLTHPGTLARGRAQPQGAVHSAGPQWREGAQALGEKTAAGATGPGWSGRLCWAQRL